MARCRGGEGRQSALPADVAGGGKHRCLTGACTAWRLVQVSLGLKFCLFFFFVSPLSLSAFTLSAVLMDTCRIIHLQKGEFT
jgi:hypothetical protein